MRRLFSLEILYKVYVRRLLAKLRSPKAQGMVEYALIISLVSLVVLFLLLTLGAQTQNLFSNVIVGLGA